MRLLIAAILALVPLAPASAQNQLQSATDAIIKSISPADLVSTLQQNGLNASYIKANEGVHYLEVNEDGAVMYFALRDCAGTDAAAQCGIVQPFGFFAGAGVTLAQLNKFNLERSAIAVAGLEADGNGIIGAKFYLQPGVTRDYILFSLGLYFVDLDTIIESIIPGTMAQVSYEKSKTARSKIANGLTGLDIGGVQSPDGVEWRVNAVGANAQSFLTPAFRALVNEGQE
jgi:hypothetical protein